MNPSQPIYATKTVPTVEIKASFSNPSFHGDVLDLKVEVLRVGGASLDLNVSGTCEAETRFSSDVTLVHVARPLKSVRWPEGVRAKLNEMLPND